MVVDLLLDIGNSRIKWAIRQGRQFTPGLAVVHQNSVIPEILQETWKHLAHPQRIAISCVATEKLMQQFCQLANRLWPQAEIIKARTQGQACGVRNAYPKPQSLGVDRWLCLLALRHYHSLPACVVDCGTAITVDVLDAQGVHQGGLITPGLTLMKKSLLTGTEKLQFCTHDYSAGLADSTESGIYNGTLYAAVGLIENVLDNASMNLILTGGDAAVIAPHLSLKVKIEPELVLQGLTVQLDSHA